MFLFLSFAVYSLMTFRSFHSEKNLHSLQLKKIPKITSNRRFGAKEEKKKKDRNKVKYNKICRWSLTVKVNSLLRIMVHISDFLHKQGKYSLLSSNEEVGEISKCILKHRGVPFEFTDL